MKNIVIYCDGTNNQFSGSHTNVIRAYKMSVRDDSQVCFYDPGVGTMRLQSTWSRVGQWWSVVCGLAAGAGFEDNLSAAYEYLMRTYVPGDKVYLFGFSRGAYTARALAGMLHTVGLLHPGTENLIRYAIRYWKQYRGADSPTGKTCAEFKQTLARDCPVEFVGVWDTVSSVGWINHLKTYPFTADNPNVAHVRHAVSIDERRCMFRQNLMAPAKEKPQQDVKNVWFSGVHSDVGGGYPAVTAGLAKIALQWMMDEAEACGLKIDPEAYDREVFSAEAPNIIGEAHNSLTVGWWVVEFLPVRRYSFETGKRYWSFSLGSRRRIQNYAHLPTTYVHESVVQRMEAMPDYRPSNLPGNPDAVRKMFRIAPSATRRAPADSPVRGPNLT